MYNFLKKAMYHVSAFLFAVAVLIAFISVIFRYVFNNSLYWSEEIVRYIFIWMFFIAMGESTRTGSHVALDLVPSKLSGTTRKVWDIVIEVLSLVFVIILVCYGGKLALINMNQFSPALRIPYGWIYMALPFGGALMGVFNIIRIVNMIRGKSEEGEEC